MSVDLSQLTVLCTAFGARGGLERLARSVHSLHPQVKILAAGPSASDATCVGVDIVKSGAGDTPGSVRNALLARVRTPYFALVGDEMELHARAPLTDLLAPVAQEQVDLAAGELVECRKKLLVLTSRQPAPGHGCFSHESGGLALRPGLGAVSDGVSRCDYAHQFFVARTDKVRAMGGWDHQLISGGDLEFFVRAERFDLRIGVEPALTAWHWGHASPPSETVSVEAVERMNLARLCLPNGAVVTPPPARMAA